MLSQIEILSKLNESSLFILPPVAEGRPKVVAEALATGLPCVVSSACNCDDLVEGAGIIINNLSPNSIADSISSVLSEPETWKKMSENAEINAKTSAWNVIARNEQDRITKILELETLNFNRT